MFDFVERIVRLVRQCCLDIVAGVDGASACDMPRRYTGERSPIQVLTGLDVATMVMCTIPLSQRTVSHVNDDTDDERADATT